MSHCFWRLWSELELPAILRMVAGISESDFGFGIFLLPLKFVLYMIWVSNSGVVSRKILRTHWSKWRGHWRWCRNRWESNIQSIHSSICLELWQINHTNGEKNSITIDTLTVCHASFPASISEFNISFHSSWSMITSTLKVDTGDALGRYARSLCWWQT